uniref:Phenazine biosynthesis-like domain-containing protein n=1 Tax=Caenorhabditis japonica TaxID=281687 RepID=A0A8R1E2Q6_CAEJA
MAEHYPSYIVDAFTKKRFSGNPAAVCLIPQVLKDEEYLKIAEEFNLSETAFPVPIGSKDFKLCSQFSLRWFTPKTEVPLCGHATLATSHVLFNELGNVNKEIKFDTQSGVLIVKSGETGNVEMNFPEYDLTSITFPHTLNALHGLFSEFKAPSFLFDVVKCVVPTEMAIEYIVYSSKARKLVVVVDPQTTKFELEAVKIDSARMLEIHDGSFVRGLAITLRPRNAKIQGFADSSDEPYDYACRYFAPWVGINEDPATGSAQCVMGPFWAKITGKNELYALQAYPNRGAQFRVRLDDGRVILNGPSVTVLRGEITLDEPTFY